MPSCCRGRNSPVRPIGGPCCAESRHRAPSMISKNRRCCRERKVLYQFSARGHELTQVLLGALLTGVRDGVGAYYRSRPLLLSLGLTPEEALASTMMRAGGMSEGRDIGVVFNLPRRSGACVLPVCGGVGTQYTPAVGWAQALRYRSAVLGDQQCEAASPSPTAEMPRRPRTDSGPHSI